FLSDLPASHLAGLQTIVNYPVYSVSQSLGYSELGLALPAQVMDGRGGTIAVDRKFAGHDFFGLLGHEVGHLVQFSTLSSDEKWQWIHLFRNSHDLYRDFVNDDSYVPIISDSPHSAAYGSTNVREDFASVYGNWATNSVYLMMESMARAQIGNPMML